MANTIYQDIACRTGGDIYIGVVGPVRSGKSTFIKRFMEQLVIPHIPNEAWRERATDELIVSLHIKFIFVCRSLYRCKYNTIWECRTGRSNLFPIVARYIIGNLTTLYSQCLSCTYILASCIRWTCTVKTLIFIALLRNKCLTG